jgi:hypothetical protein
LHDPADNFMPGDQWQRWLVQVAVYDMQIRAADTASLNREPNLSRTAICRCDILKSKL